MPDAQHQDSSTTAIELTQIAERGIALCRDGQWQKGMRYLAAVAQAKHRGLTLPGRFYSYLGYGMANFENRYREGLALCKQAVKIEFYQPENYLNLAHTYLLMGNRRMAVGAIERGLTVDPASSELIELLHEVGKRRRPVLGFLGRANPLNQFLGRLRSHLLRAPEPT